MICQTPRYIVNSSGNFRQMSRKYRYLPVPCGKCQACLRNKQIAWCNRLQLHASYYLYSHFVTLTYDEYHLPMFSFETGEIFSLSDRLPNQEYATMTLYDDEKDAIPCLDKLEIQRFVRSLSDLCRRHLKCRFSYFLVGEYGMENYRPHYHLIIFHDSKRLYENCKPTIMEKWNKGLVDVGTCTDASIAYVTKYILKEDSHPLSAKLPIFANFLLCSKGIGKDYVKEFGTSILKDCDDRDDLYLINNRGYKSAMPRYLKDKLIPSAEWNEVNSFQLIDKITQNERQTFETWVHQHRHVTITNENRDSLFAEWLKNRQERRQISHKR